MTESEGYAVYLFPGALETLGEAIKPYLHEGPGGPHVLCREIDTAGALVEMTLAGRTGDGRQVERELMVPVGMVKMIVSARSDETFGFGPRAEVAATTLPPVGPGGQPVDAPPEAMPHTGEAPDSQPTPTPPKP